MRRLASIALLALTLAACAERAGLEEPCQETDDCASGLRCLGFTGDTRCRKLGADGDPCWSTKSDGCSSGLVCSQGVCVSPGSKVAEDLCSYNVDCAAGLICSWKAKPYTCQPPALLNEGCGHPTDCAGGLTCPELLLGSSVCTCPPCPGSQVCSSRGCIDPDTVAPGEQCEHNVDCKGDLVCVWAQKPYVCAETRKLDESCGHPTDCQQGLTCDEGLCRQTCQGASDCPDGQACTSGGLCVAPAGAGAACAEDVGCKGGLWCHEQRCLPRLPAGGECPTVRIDGAAIKGGDSACQEPLSCVISCDGDGSKGTCRARLPKGTACELCPSPGVCDGLSAGWCNGGCEIGLVCTNQVCSEP